MPDWVHNDSTEAHPDVEAEIDRECSEREAPLLGDGGSMDEENRLEGKRCVMAQSNLPLFSIQQS